MLLLYIGSNDATIERLGNDQEIELIKRDSGFSAFEYLKNISVVPDAILAEVDTPGLKGADLAKHLTLKGISAIPYFIIGKKFSREEAVQLLQSGIVDGYPFELKVEHLKARIAFLKAHSNVKSRAIEHQEYRIPVVKRVFDILVAGLILIIISPILLLVVLAIRIESKGKVYYISKRVGTGYRIFDFYKLRSMYTGADSRLKDLKHLNQYSAESDETVEAECPECRRLGRPCSPILMVDGGEICESFYLKRKKAKNASAFIKIKDDPRITRVGNFIRNTSIDELPQLINVIKGDMSIVGNRPLPLYEAEMLTSDEWILRFIAPSGITGLWQTKKRGKGSMSEEERKGLDNEYAVSYSFMNDIKIILMTIPALLQKENV